jgi:hypothetical protein
LRALWYVVYRDWIGIRGLDLSSPGGVSTQKIVSQMHWFQWRMACGLGLRGVRGWFRIPPSTHFFFLLNKTRIDSGNLSREFSDTGNPNPSSDFGYRVRKIPISVPDPIFPPKYRKRMDIVSGDYFILNQQKSANFLVYNMWGYGKISFPTFRTPMGWSGFFRKNTNFGIKCDWNELWSWNFAQK